jgi:hypothetical protein
MRAPDPVAEQTLPIRCQLPMFPATMPSATIVRTTMVSSARIFAQCAAN